VRSSLAETIKKTEIFFCSPNGSRSTFRAVVPTEFRNRSRWQRSQLLHFGPVRAKLLGPEQRLGDYRWSSWPEYLKKPGKRWDWLRVDRLLGEWGVRQDNAAGRRQLEQAMEQRKELEREWIARRLGMGHWRTAANAVRLAALKE
jgi:hypothetical protein